MYTYILQWPKVCKKDNGVINYIINTSEQVHWKQCTCSEGKLAMPSLARMQTLEQSSPASDFRLQCFRPR